MAAPLSGSSVSGIRASLSRIRASAEWRFFGVVRRAAPGLAAAWWALVALRGLLPAAFVLSMGALVGAVELAHSLTWPLIAMGVTFVGMQVASPFHDAVSSNLGVKVAAWLQDRLLAACVGPAGLAHLERPDLADDLALAREVDKGVTGPDIPTSMPNIGTGFGTYAAGFANVALLFAFRWWAPLVVGGAWLSTHYFLRSSALWLERHDPEVADQQRRAGYAYRLSVDSPAAKEMRLFGLGDWVVGGMRTLRLALIDRSWEARRLGRRHAELAMAVVAAGNLVFFVALGRAAADGRIGLGTLTVLAQAALGSSALAFGEYDWWLRNAAQPIPLLLDLTDRMALAGDLGVGARNTAGDLGVGARSTVNANMPAVAIRFEGVSFAYPAGGQMVFEGLDLTIPAGHSLAIVGQNGAGKTTLAKLLCRLYDPTAGRITIDDIDLCDLDPGAWRERVAAVFQDFVRYELPLRDNVAPGGGDGVGEHSRDEAVVAALIAARADDLADLDTVLNRGYEGGTELSGGQWQRVALARAIYAVQAGAGLVILDEPTAQLDVRGEAEIFDGLLEATRGCTTILVSHRFSTVRRADQICVLEHGHVIELGSHDELMALGGRYHTMFELQASRFENGASRFENGAEQ
jgi:ABC-type multidrug transport system fused ATPase/permease subunit